MSYLYKNSELVAERMVKLLSDYYYEDGRNCRFCYVESEMSSDDLDGFFNVDYDDNGKTPWFTFTELVVDLCNWISTEDLFEGNIAVIDEACEYFYSRVEIIEEV